MQYCTARYVDTEEKKNRRWFRVFAGLIVSVVERKLNYMFEKIFFRTIDELNKEKKHGGVYFLLINVEVKPSDVADNLNDYIVENIEAEYGGQWIMQIVWRGSWKYSMHRLYDNKKVEMEV